MACKNIEKKDHKIKRTSKKTKIIGKRDYIDSETGELKTMDVISCESQDFNFHKIWLGHIIQCLDLIGNKKIKIINFILENINYENKLCMSMSKISDKTEICLKTVKTTIKTLLDNKILIRVQNCVYMVHPNMIFKGKHGNRMNILIEYNKEISKDDARLKIVK